MTFIPITTGEIAVGEPLTNSTATKIKDNFDNLDERITDVETGSSTVYGPIVLNVNGEYSTLTTPYTNLLKTTINFNITVTGVRLIIDDAGTSGTTEIDIKFKRGSGSYTSILSTKPSVAYSAGDDSTSTNAVLNPGEVDLQAGDIIRLDLTSSQSRASSFIVRIDYIKA